MACHRIVVFAILMIVAVGCATDPPRSSASPKANPGRMPTVTVPNGSSPAKANAPHAPMNDASREGWNHGNGDLWVNLPPQGQIHLADVSVEKDGSYRVKFPWWRARPGRFWIDGRRLDAPAPPLRFEAGTDAQYGAFGPVANIIFFPTDGFWEVTGHLDDKTLTFVVQLVK